jgi:hypothetical protein
MEPNRLHHALHPLNPESLPTDCLQETTVKDFQLLYQFGASPQRLQVARVQRSQGQQRSLQHIATPTSASPQSVLYIAGEDTKPPTYISQSNFFPPEHGDEHRIERSPAYMTKALRFLLPPTLCHGSTG